jgi:hypothetical protein
VSSTTDITDAEHAVKREDGQSGASCHKPEALSWAARRIRRHDIDAEICHGLGRNHRRADINRGPNVPECHVDLLTDGSRDGLRGSIGWDVHNAACGACAERECAQHHPSLPDATVRLPDGSRLIPHRHSSARFSPR